jgi:hypothetical protein
MIYELLRPGRQNAMTTAEIMAITGIKTKREIVRHISIERRKHVICTLTSPPGGYYLPASRQDIIENRNYIDRRGKRTLYARKAAAAALKEIDGQEFMPGLI